MNLDELVSPLAWHVEDAEYLRFLEGNRVKADVAERRVVDEDFTRLLEGDFRKSQEADRLAMEQEERRRQAEREATERAS